MWLGQQEAQYTARGTPVRDRGKRGRATAKALPWNGWRWRSAVAVVVRSVLQCTSRRRAPSTPRLDGHRRFSAVPRPLALDIHERQRIVRLLVKAVLVGNDTIVIRTRFRSRPVHRPMIIPRLHPPAACPPANVTFCVQGATAPPLATTTNNPAAFSRPAHEREENYQQVIKSTCLLEDFYRPVSLDDGNAHRIRRLSTRRKPKDELRSRGSAYKSTCRQGGFSLNKSLLMTNRHGVDPAQLSPSAPSGSHR